MHNFLDHPEGVVSHYHRTTTVCPSDDHAPKKMNPLNQPTNKTLKKNPHLIKKHRRLSQNMPRLNQLLRSLTERLITLIHRSQPQLMLRQRRIQLINRLRSTRANSDQRGALVQRPYGYDVLLLCDLGREEADTTGHLVDAPDFAHEGTLEWVDAWV